MRICIVTLYKTINSGSFLQAYALKKYLENNGHEVCFLKIKYTFKVRLRNFLKYPKSLIKNGFTGLKILFNTNREFYKMQKMLNLDSYKDVMKKADIIVLGSDTIWNIDSENLLKLREVFFGNIFEDKKKISYAASFANAKLEKLNKYQDIKEGLNNINYISVRDTYSLDIANKLSNKKAYLVCDPTLLLDKKEYNSLVSKKENEKYIFTYLFSDLSDAQKKELKDFAKKRGLKIISGTQKYGWCNEKVSNTPDTFLSYINGAEYVITDTFHGTIFSTIFNKNYVVINRNKKKVNDFITRIKLNEKLVNNDEFISVLNNEIDYVEINSILSDYRKDSIEFLYKALETEGKE